jgi:hypothetical protein
LVPSASLRRSLPRAFGHPFKVEHMNIVWLILTLAPACILPYALIRRSIRMADGQRGVGRIIEIRTFKAARSRSTCPVVEVTFPDGKSVAVRTGEQNIFTRYQVGQTVPVILLREQKRLRVYINTPSERFPPRFLLLSAIFFLPAIFVILNFVR